MNLKLFTTIGVILILWAHLLSAQVTTGADQKSWQLETRHMTYALKVVNGQLLAGWYGPRLSQPESMLTPFQGKPEVPVRGGVPNKMPVLEVVFADGTRDLDLEYVSYEVSVQGGYPLLKIVQKDRYYPFQVTAFYRVIPEYDLIEKWLEISHSGNSGNIRLENSLSGSLWLPRGAYEMTHLSGIHGHEFQPETSRLTQGIKTIQSRDFKTYGASWFAIRPTGETAIHHGEVWYGQLHYSGNWRGDFESMPDDRVQVVSGINFWDTEWNLGPGETFATPVFSFGYTSLGTDGVAQNYAGYIRKLILPAKRSGTPRPVIYNSWYATEFDIHEKQQLDLAKVAKELGVEMFVIDDGWFRGRVNSKGGLGDWTVDKNKFPEGLEPLIRQVNEMGMEFGIWVEPEMVNPNSDLYRAHPDWVLHFNNRPRTLGRNQLMLNLAREDVFQYLYQSLTDLLRNHRIRFLKWDMNKSLTEPGWPDAEPAMQREVRIRYIQNFYRMHDLLSAEFPDVWFETCSSGGGRVDLGVFRSSDFAWVSDNIDPLDRILIQYGYLHAFPANTMISWTGEHDNHGIRPSLAFRFDVAMSGVLGISNDLTRWDPGTVKIAREKVTLFKKIRETVHNGTLFRLSSPFEGNRAILQYTNETMTESVIFFYQLEDQLKGSSAFPYQEQYVRLKGLDAGAIYRVEGENKVYSGHDLMATGIPYPLNRVYTSRILVLKSEKNKN